MPSATPKVPRISYWKQDTFFSAQAKPVEIQEKIFDIVPTSSKNKIKRNCRVLFMTRAIFFNGIYELSRDRRDLCLWGSRITSIKSLLALIRSFVRAVSWVFVIPLSLDYMGS